MRVLLIYDDIMNNKLTLDWVEVAKLKMLKVKRRRLHFDRLRQNLHYWDYYLLIPYLVLCLIGIVMVYSASAAIEMQNGGTPGGYLVKQTLYAILGWLTMVFFANYPLKKLRTRKFLEITTIVMGLMLIGVLVIGRAVNGAKGWISLGFFSIQPAELCKLYLILYLADRMAHGRRQGAHFLQNKSAIGPMLMVAFFLFLILVQPDTGGFAINLAIVTVMILACDFRWGLGLTVVLGFPIAGYLAMEQMVTSGLLHGGYRAQRFIAFMNPFGNASGSGSQLVNSYYAISNGGIFGVGLGNSVQKMGYLPEPNTDFIMAITSEELGLVGVSIILLLLLVLVCRMIQLGVRSTSLYQTLVCYGSAVFFTVETAFNIGGVLGLLPITGVTFPFISYGGSSMLVLSAVVGIITNISIQQNKQRLQMGAPFLADSSRGN